MNKETNLFNPVDLELSRSTFEYHPTVSGTAMAGRLYPAFAFEVLPGDSIKMDLNTLIKMSTPVYPTMDRLYLDVAFFFVPNRLILGRRYGSPAVDDETHSWKSFIGAQDNLLNCPVPAEGVELPKFTVGTAASIPGSIADCLGYPSSEVNDQAYLVNCLEMLSYVAIYNENFRDPNTSEPVTWSIGATNLVNLKGVVSTVLAKSEYDPGGGAPNYNWRNALDPANTGPVSNANNLEVMMPFATCRFHGYFGSCLPWPQRNSVGVELPLGKEAPVVPGEEEHIKNGDKVWPILNRLGASVDSDGKYTVSGLPNTKNLPASGGADSHLGLFATTVDSDGDYAWQFTNLYADLSQATAANVNALRLAVQKQRWYEKLARSGNRFDELEYGLFGVRPHDSGDDRPLYLGGKRIPLSIEMVASTQGGSSPSGSEGAGSLGALGAFSHTNDSDHYFYHSFDEWGTLMCVFTIRHHTTASNRLKRSLVRNTKFDYYWPTFAHLGEMYVKKSEVSADDVTKKDDVFGYQEAWAEYRYEPDVVTGLIRPGRSLGFMTYAEKFGASVDLATYLNASSQIASVDKTLAVKSYTSGFQFVYQFNFDFTARRAMPQYSIPGLVDHF